MHSVYHLSTLLITRRSEHLLVSYHHGIWRRIPHVRTWILRRSLVWHRLSISAACWLSWILGNLRRLLLSECTRVLCQSVYEVLNYLLGLGRVFLYLSHQLLSHLRVALHYFLD